MENKRKKEQKDALPGGQLREAGEKKKPQKKHPKLRRLRLWVKKHRLLVLAMALVILALAALFGTKIALLANFLLGNDIIIRLSADRESLFLVHGGNATVNFDVSVTTNPFCSAACSSVFEDLGGGSIVEEASFSLRPAIPEKKTYTVHAARAGMGLDLYRFRVTCRSVRTLLCHTDEEPTVRSILLTVARNLTAEEKEAQERSRQVIAALLGNGAELQGRQAALRAAMVALNETLAADELFDGEALIAEQLAGHRAAFGRLQEAWEVQDPEAVAQQLGALQSRILETETALAALTGHVEGNISRLGVLGEELQAVWEAIAALRAQPFTNASRAAAVNESSSALGALTDAFGQHITLEEKEAIVAQRAGELLADAAQLQRQQEEEALVRAVEADISADAQCTVSGICVAHPSITERAVQRADLADACTLTESVRAAALVIVMANESYPDTAEFRQNITAKALNLKSNITTQYRAQLPPNATNTLLLEELLVASPPLETAAYEELNLTAALHAELTRQLPEACVFINASFGVLEPPAVPDIIINASVPVPMGISFADPLPQCCLKGQCQACCVDAQCRDDPALFPVVFLHGHAFNKDTSAEYSLDAFNKIQQRLEEDGSISAGAISLYTPQDAAQEMWGMLRAPLTLKASYYLDLFREPENYVVVQTKSESIDTYAVRLKELIGTIKQKTGRQKVVIIPHSMGGLVARRYLQVFGSEHIAKLIMIGTPNSGVVGNIADYCPLVGEKLECRDMHANSLFMNKLSRGPAAAIHITNIVGTGCAMDGNEGDGVVLAERAWLAGARNVLVKGSCSRFETLHTELLDVGAYPQVYEALRAALEEG